MQFMGTAINPAMNICTNASIKWVPYPKWPESKPSSDAKWSTMVWTLFPHQCFLSGSWLTRLVPNPFFHAQNHQLKSCYGKSPQASRNLMHYELKNAQIDSIKSGPHVDRAHSDVRCLERVARTHLFFRSFLWHYFSWSKKGGFWLASCSSYLNKT